jgi:MFS transporter, DHA2 family, methylenomycin A resistance protein
MPQTTRSVSVAVLAPIFAGTFVALLDLSIVQVALPTTQEELSTDVAGVQWVVDAFALSSPARWSARPRRRLASCSPGAWVQGIAAAAIVPGTLSLVTQLEPDPQRGLRPSLLTAGLVVLAGAALLVAMPATRRERAASSPPAPGAARGPRFEQRGLR